jgi:hypothetical protein
LAELLNKLHDQYGSDKLIVEVKSNDLETAFIKLFNKDQEYGLFRKNAVGI